MATGVTIAIRGDSGDVKNTLNEVSGDIDSMATNAVAKGQLIADAISAAFRKMIEIGKEVVSLFNTQERVEVKLAAVIKATGQAAGFTAEEMYKQAAALQAITTTGDEVIINMQAVLATFKEIKGQEFIDAQKAALDLAAVLDSDVKGAALQLGKALNDPIKGITALSRAGVSFTEEQKEMIRTMVKAGEIQKAQRVILDELQNQFGGTAEAIAGTFGGRMEQVSNRIGDLGERLGGMVATVVEKFIPAMEAGVTAMENFFPVLERGAENVANFSESVLGPMKESLEWLLATGVTVFTVFEFTVTKAMDVTKTVLLTAMLTVVKMGNTVQHVFTEVIPAYLTWLNDNWKNIFTDMAEATGAILTNMGQNIQMFFEQVQSWLKGDGFNFKWTGLLEGFESTLSELPDVMERTKSPLEKAMERALKGMQNKNRQTFDEMIDANMNKIRDLLGMNFNPSDGTDPLKDPGRANRNSVINKEKKEEKQATARFEALEALNKRIQAAAFLQKDPDERAADAAEENADISKKQLQKLEEENALLNEMVAVNTKLSQQIPMLGALT